MHTEKETSWEIFFKW